MGFRLILDPHSIVSTAMNDAGIIELVLQVKGNLTQDGGAALSESFRRIDAATIERLNQACPSGSTVGRIEVERALTAGTDANRMAALSKTAWVAEALQRWYGWQGEDGDCNLEPLDLSMIQRLFDACDVESPDYDREFHLQLYEEKPHFFGEDGLPKP